MNAPRTSTPTLKDDPISVRTKLAAAWASFMFFFIYVDYFSLYKPGIVDDILAGIVFKFDISQSFVVFGLTLVGIPALMILLSTILPARASRITNLVVASLYVPVSVFNLAGGSWLAFYGLGVVVEVAIIALILRIAWTWPRGLPANDEGSTATSARGPVARPRTSSAPTRALT